MTTISHWALFWDLWLAYLCYKTAENCDEETRPWAIGLLLGWMFISKFIKVIGHYVRYPVDFLLLPISIVFGYFHGLIKAYAILTVKVVRLSHFPVEVFYPIKSPQVFLIRPTGSEYLRYSNRTFADGS